MAEKAAIVCIYLVVFILKLWSFKIFNPVVYSDIKEHLVFLLQNLALLLTFFLFSSLALYNIMCIVWAKRKYFTNLDLQHFKLVKKQTLFNVLI